MITYIAPKGSAIEFNGDALDTVAVWPDSTQAIVRKDNGRFAVARYETSWCIWSDEDYKTQFQAMIAAGAVVKCDGKWLLDVGARYATH